MPSDPAVRFARTIIGSRKYRSLCPETAQDVYRQEVTYGGRPKEVEERARRRLHRLWAGYLGGPSPKEALGLLKEATSRGAEQIRRVCREILQSHQSSRERIPVMDELYRSIFSITGAPEGLLDLACALNPLALPWMGLGDRCRYCAFDINRHTVSLVSGWFGLIGRTGYAEHRDVLVNPVTEEADVALLLKMYHCLEHRRKGAGWEVVSGVPARWIAVSFPSRNLAGRAVNIMGNYESHIRERCASRGWRCHRLAVPTEQVLLVRKD